MPTEIGHAKIVREYGFVMTKVGLENYNLLQITSPSQKKNSNENLTACELRKSKLRAKNV